MENEYNLSFLLLCPLLFEKNDVGFFENSKQWIENGYIGDINKPWLDNHFMISVSIENSPEYKISKFQNHKDFTGRYTYLIHGEWLDIYSFEIPDSIKRDYENIVNGRLNSISVTNKSIILNYWKSKELSSLVEKIITKEEFASGISEEIVPERQFTSRNVI